MLQLCSVVIFDNFVVLVSRLLVVFHTDFYCVINVIGIYIYWVPVTLVRAYLGMVTCFRARLCWGGGG